MIALFLTLAGLALLALVGVGLWAVNKMLDALDGAFDGDLDHYHEVPYK